MTAENPRQVGWGILSTGHIASVFAADLALLPDEAVLAAVGSRAASKAEAFASEYGFDRAYGSYAELAADENVDVVYIGSVHNDHFGSAKLCLEAGKAVLVEKPLTVSDAEAAELVRLAGDRNLFLMEAVWTRTNPLIRKATEIVRSGELGPVRHVAVSFGFAFDGDESHRLLDPEQAGGAILDLGVYPVHGVNLFLGEPEKLLGYGSYAGTGVDSHAAATLTYPATNSHPAATASVLCTLEANVPTRLEV
ncbi:MAG: Gfo/Idh/MocA family oxidoreductase, partial [Propionibacteriaceae bacterium]|nr:Gfo/Idh/MocA family oxidoreductase [Propionibacteriaceae bacterium]